MTRMDFQDKFYIGGCEHLVSFLTEIGPIQHILWFQETIFKVNILLKVISFFQYPNDTHEYNKKSSI